ncbi:MAG: hypothetical protein Fur0018_12520 [Anaerolineales bacterium]
MQVTYTLSAGMVHAFCPICGRECDDKGVRYPGRRLSPLERYQAWLAWLQTVGLTHEELKRIYHFDMQDFFTSDTAASETRDCPVIIK